MKHLLATTATLISLAVPAFADPEANRATALRALTEMFDAQNVELIDELYHPDYIQHSPSIADGREGIRSGVTWMQNNNLVPIREIARVLAQGDLVGIQSRVTIGDSTTAIVGDIFRFEDGQIIEHWDTTQEEVPQSETANGNSMIDGGGDTSLYMSNMDLARNTVNAVDFFAMGIAGDVATLERLFGDEYVQHNPRVPNGVDAIYSFFADSDGMLGNVTVHQTIAEGDLTMALVEYADWGNAVIEILRHDENGQIVEHWDIVQAIPAAEEFAHDNGMF
jgi:predicted SnoaL-like aldol condensation-catalyzing enzyme